MPAGRFRTVSISEEIYEKLKKIADERKTSISKTIEQIVSGVETTTFDESTIRRIVREEISRALEEIKAMLYNITSESNKPEKEKKRLTEAIKEAFLGKRKPITMKKPPIQISKGNIFVEVKEKPKIDLSKLKAKIVAETNEKGETIGYSIVPNIGFENMSLEDWFNEYGAELIKELTTIS
ncbi:MAG TPA: hypothetical protein ENG16_05305 [Archaeoglobus sp.]|nr:hypothetical protein [Archaeoglobus sp.]